jgi:putative lumazine-binding protein
VRLGPLLAVLLCSVGLAACGSTVSTASFKGESNAVAKRISNFQSDVTAGEDGKLCNSDLAKAVRTRLQATGVGCARALKKQLVTLDDYELTVESIAVHGATAAARVKSTWGGKLRLDTLGLVKEGGAWRIAAVQ